MNNELVGKRLLLKLGNNRYTEVTEYKLLEISPSGNWRKLMGLNGRRFWVAAADAELVEVLKDLRAERMAERATLED